jgi:hypothetical protein
MEAQVKRNVSGIVINATGIQLSGRQGFFSKIFRGSDPYSLATLRCTIDIGEQVKAQTKERGIQAKEKAAAERRFNDWAALSRVDNWDPYVVATTIAKIKENVAGEIIKPVEIEATSREFVIRNGISKLLEPFGIKTGVPGHKFTSILEGGIGIFGFNILRFTDPNNKDYIALRDGNTLAVYEQHERAGVRAERTLRVVKKLPESEKKTAASELLDKPVVKLLIAGSVLKELEGMVKTEGTI